ncbi:hypothetical protein [Achromobacter sp. JUb104]|uniref:hypothetical protein n=1 Tax=Achromobacter sp. JUb104 TaxID=2940590 RepID=UPI002169FFAD|nr:hypothetical protein [Achromobacter sp. JUb104]MCS3507481.1 hypothetical protein [Achromobacter sp. JUb104]
MEIGQAVRRFNELAVPGTGGVWFAKQVFLAILGIRVAELARYEKMAVGNIECANAIEALACWHGFNDNKWAQHPRLRGIHKFPRQHALDFRTLRRPGFYVSQPMRMAVGQSLMPLGLADGQSRRFNALSTNEIGQKLITLACGEGSRYDVLTHLLNWVQGKPVSWPPRFVKLLSPCVPLSAAARGLLHAQLMLGAGNESIAHKTRRRAALQWVEDVRNNPPAMPMRWEDRPTAIADDAHWLDLRAGAQLMACRDQALLVLDELERALLSVRKATMSIEDAAETLTNELAGLRRSAEQYLALSHTDPDAMSFCRECALASTTEQLEHLLRRDGRVLRLVGRQVKPGSAVRRTVQNADPPDLSSAPDPDDAGLVDGVIAWPAGLSFRMRNLYALNRDIREEPDATSNDITNQDLEDVAA